MAIPYKIEHVIRDDPQRIIYYAEITNLFIYILTTRNVNINGIRKNILQINTCTDLNYFLLLFSSD